MSEKGSMDEIINTIKEILFDVMGAEINDLNINLFSRKYECNAGDMIILIMELKKKYNISVERLVDNIKEYSVNSISEEVYKQISEGLAA